MAASATLPPAAPGDAERMRTLDALYAELPRLVCKGLCAASCGPVPMGRLEWRRVCLSVREVRQGADDLVCPLLRSGRCEAHKVRPMLCRLWGMVESMPCLWGCEPERMLSDDEGYEFLARAHIAST